MLCPNLLHRRQRQVRRAPRGPARPRLLLEWLEPRNLMSVMNVNTDTDLTSPHFETSIAVNPTNSQNLIGSAADYQFVYSSSGAIVSITGFARAHVTFDGGHSWTDYPIQYDPNLYNRASDPAVAFDADGTAYLATVGFIRLPNGGNTPPDVLVAHSADGGQSWSVPLRVAAGSGTSGSTEVSNDKEYITAWGHGNAIVTWTEFTYDKSGNFVESPIFASVTHDGGNTWTPPVEISGNLTLDQASVPVLAADGSLYVAFMAREQLSIPNVHDQYMVVKVSSATGQAVQKPVKACRLGW
jgi:hypothetical protein